MRQMAMDQKSNEKPQPAVAKVQTVKPTPISLNGLTLQNFTGIKESKFHCKGRKKTKIVASVKGYNKA